MQTQTTPALMLFHSLLFQWFLKGAVATTQVYKYSVFTSLWHEFLIFNHPHALGWTRLCSLLCCRYLTSTNSTLSRQSMRCIDYSVKWKGTETHLCYEAFYGAVMCHLRHITHEHLAHLCPKSETMVKHWIKPLNMLQFPLMLPLYRVYIF